MTVRCVVGSKGERVVVIPTKMRRRSRKPWQAWFGGFYMYGKAHRVCRSGPPFRILDERRWGAGYWNRRRG